MTEPENLVLQMLRDMRENMATKAEIAELRSEINSFRADISSEMRSLRADVASDMLTLEGRLSEQMAGIRRAVMEYHSSTIGHGVLISEIDERLRRVEQHLNLLRTDPH